MMKLNIQWTIKNSVLFTIGLILCVDSVVLFALGKIYLGTILLLCIGLIFCLLVIYQQKIQVYLQHNTLFSQIYYVAWTGFFIWLLSFVLFCGYLESYLQQQQEIKISPDVIIVLGSQVKNGYPTPALQSRLDTSAQLAQRYPNSYLLMTGGVDLGETISEAEAMAEYVQKTYSISPQRILIENKSTSTELNFKLSQEILSQHHITLQQPMIIVSNDFHLLRAEKIAKKLGYREIQMYPASTPLSMRYNAWLREYFALMSGKILAEY